MKRIISATLAIIFVLSCLVGCGGDKKLTEENVKELFLPTFEAYTYLLGSYFYEIERNPDRSPVDYPSDDTVYLSFFKVTTDITKEELIEKMNKYYAPGYKDNGTIITKDNDLYVANLDTNYIGMYFDLESIRLLGEDENGYYIAIDTYGTNWDDESDQPITYYSTQKFRVKYNDGILQIQDPPELDGDKPVNNYEDTDIIFDYDRLIGHKAV